MGSKAHDPFGDIMAGVLGKQTMAEQKASMAGKPPATPQRPAAASGGASANGLPATPPVPVAGYSGSASRPTSATIMTAGSPSRSSSALAGLDDPFAGLGGISKPAPMVAPR
jgi:hypothetical protein